MAKSEAKNNVFKFIEVFETNLKMLKSDTETFKAQKNIDFSVVYDLGTDSERRIKYNSIKMAEDICESAAEFLENFKSYVKSGVCTNSKLEKKIAVMMLEGLSKRDIETALNIQSPTFRTCISRFTKDIYKAIWGSKGFPNDIIYLSNSETYIVLIKKLRIVSSTYDFKGILPYDYLSLTNKICNDCKKIEKYDEYSEEYFRAFRLVTMFSMAAFEEELNKVDKYALRYVLDALKRKGKNFTSNNFKLVMENPSQWLYKTPEDFRRMLVDNKDLFPIEEEPAKKSRLKEEDSKTTEEVVDSNLEENQSGVVPELDEGVELSVSNKRFKLPITNEMADFIENSIQKLNSLRESDIERYNRVKEKGQSREKQEDVKVFFTSPELGSMSIEDFKTACRGLNTFAILSYITENNLRK